MSVSSAPVSFLGAPGSPYTRKMLAALRYRRIPYRLIIGSHRTLTDLPKPKPQLLPTFYFTKDDGSIEAVVDSTPLLRRFERDFDGRSIVPPDPAIAFLDYLLEDFADEWLTKAMFHYRWHFAADAAQAGEILPRWSTKPVSEATLAPVKTFVKQRQISRLYVVGSNDTTAPVIEASYRRFLAAMKTHLETSGFLMGARPGASDFATYGQLTQLARFDPTPMAITLAEAPRVYAWTEVVEDLSGMEPTDFDWMTRENIPETLREIFVEMGRTYMPVMLANAQAVARRA
ncbi:MAG: glutathione S-transferase, partial [Rhodoblastus sp.]|nr:glutathione S-transferase [Rhodoblastus sp.]